MKIVPIRREETKEYFCTHTASWIVQKGFEELQTNYLKPNQPVNLLALSATMALLDTGILDSTDGLDPNISMDKLAILFVKNGVQRIYIHDVAAPTASFVFAGEGNYRALEMRHEEQLLVTSGNVQGKVSLRLFGLANLELGDVSVHTDMIDYPTALADSARVVGYSLNAYRYNHNRQKAAA